MLEKNASIIYMTVYLGLMPTPLFHFTLDPCTHQYVALAQDCKGQPGLQPTHNLTIWLVPSGRKPCLWIVAPWIKPAVPWHYQLTLQMGRRMHGVPVLHERTSSFFLSCCRKHCIHVHCPVGLRLGVSVNKINVKKASVCGWHTPLTS